MFILSSSEIVSCLLLSAAYDNVPILEHLLTKFSFDECCIKAALQIAIIRGNTSTFAVLLHGLIKNNPNFQRDFDELNALALIHRRDIIIEMLLNCGAGTSISNAQAHHLLNDPNLPISERDWIFDIINLSNEMISYLNPTNSTHSPTPPTLVDINIPGEALSSSEPSSQIVRNGFLMIMLLLQADWQRKQLI